MGEGLGLQGLRLRVNRCASHPREGLGQRADDYSQLKLSVGVTSPSNLAEIEGLFTQGSEH